MRWLIPSRYTKVSPWKNRLLRSIRTASPWFHMPLLMILVFVPFIHHYALTSNVSLYIKRLGRLSYVLVVLNVLLTLRPGNPIFGFNYLDFISLHKWLSRFVTVIGIIHGIGFIVKWSIDPSVSMISKATRLYNFIGVVAFVPLSVLLFVSIRAFRRYSYKTFYIAHQLAQWSMVFLIPIHARPRVTVPYFIILLVLYVQRGISYSYHSSTVHVTQRVKDETSLTYVKVDRGTIRDWLPGSHLRISKYKKRNPLYWLMPTKPYTIASLPDENQVDLVIRENSVPYVVVGEYTVVDVYSTVPPTLLYDSQRVAIVVGGSGISFGLGIFKYLQTRNLEYLKFIWLIRNNEDMHILNQCNVDTNDLEVYVTRSLPQDDTQTKSPAANSSSEFDDIDFELETMDDSGALLTSDVKTPSKVHFGKKLDWQVDLAQFIEPRTLQNSWLVCCGPKSLLDDGQAYADQNYCNFVKEFYSL
ncbi:unnamed protein product [Kluyveromyces dobzhanskii CBS 2104]|uniref:Probable metalloreductase AIM14 n=1 Tax=Kluyveromyces dobzhanskii CBS 2104 TaxID=1427455 RepID=A0A0A8LBW1_9SACH|nr:unnamed protein product [Kluyveromyces dobzhanskii CBS 2104]